MRVLITGRSGSGKSTVCSELKRQGFPGFDTDKIPGLARWVDATTHQPVEVDYTRPIDRATTLWWWDETLLRDLLTTYDGVFFCGSADNDLGFVDAFDKVFVLNLSPQTQRQRIISRTEHDYGKQPDMQERILEVQRRFVQDAVAQGAIAIDAEPEPSKIVAEILRRAYDRQ